MFVLIKLPKYITFVNKQTKNYYDRQYSIQINHIYLSSYIYECNFAYYFTLIKYKTKNARFRLFIMEYRDLPKSIIINLTGNTIKPINIQDMDGYSLNVDKTKIPAIKDIIIPYLKYVIELNDPYRWYSYDRF